MSSNPAVAQRLVGPPSIHRPPPAELRGLTENGSATTYLSTNNPLLDFYFHVVPDTPHGKLGVHAKLRTVKDPRDRFCPRPDDWEKSERPVYVNPNQRKVKPVSEKWNYEDLIAVAKPEDKKTKRRNGVLDAGYGSRMWYQTEEYRRFMKELAEITTGTRIWWG